MQQTLTYQYFLKVASTYKKYFPETFISLLFKEQSTFSYKLHFTQKLPFPD